MKKTLSLLLILISMALHAQQSNEWTEADRKLLLDNLVRSRDELIKETKGLSKAQWSFKETPDRWSINQIVEHIAIWELLLDHEISRGLGAGPHPELIANAGNDDEYTKFINEEQPHYSLEYTKPFSYTIPMGLGELKNNLEWFLKMRNESVDFVTSTKDNFRIHFLKAGRGSTHQVYLTLYGHCDRHLRQIKKVKQHPKYPKN